MEAGGICPERDRLLGIANKAIDKHAKAVSDLASVAGTRQPELFAEARERSTYTLEAFRQATQAYDDHGC